MHGLSSTIGPMDTQALDSGRVAQAEEGGELALGGVAGATADPAGLPPATGLDLYAGTQPVPIRPRPTHAHLEPVAARRRGVTQQQWHTVVHRNEQVRVAIFIEVARREPSSDD